MAGPRSKSVPFWTWCFFPFLCCIMFGDMPRTLRVFDELLRTMFGRMREEIIEGGNFNEDLHNLYSNTISVMI
jgi:hypothetical protein